MLLQSAIKREPSITRSLLIDPADWLGPEAKNRDDWRFQPDEIDVADLEAALSNVERTDLDPICVTTDQLRFAHFGDKLKAVKRQLNEGLGFVLIRELPIDRYTRTQAATIYWGIGVHLSCSRYRTQSRGNRSTVLQYEAEFLLSLLRTESGVRSLWFVDSPRSTAPFRPKRARPYSIFRNAQQGPLKSLISIGKPGILRAPQDVGGGHAAIGRKE